MDIKFADDAVTSLKGLPPSAYTQVFRQLQSWTSTPEHADVRVSDGDGRGAVRVRRLAGNLRAVYQVRDADHDGEDEVVVLDIVDPAQVQEAYRRATDFGLEVETGNGLGRQLLDALLVP